MASEVRRSVADAGELAALAHPLRLDLINHLMAVGGATASECARAVGDTPSNCSYHLRVLARAGLVAAGESGDGRERPWRATVTGFGTDQDRAEPERAAALAAVALQRDQRLAREYLARRDEVDPRWRAADGHATYTLRMTPDELGDLGERLDALIRPFLAATRTDAPAGSAAVHLGVHAFPLPLSGQPLSEPVDGATP
jgi:DNA-binding transcriptional ArsR family regulator